jgi:hypothetical protein
VTSYTRRWAASAIAAIVLSAGAQKAAAAVVALDPSGAQSIYQRDADRALAPTPDTVVTVYRSNCPDERVASGRGCTYPDGRIYLPGAYDPEGFLHELGHQFDYATQADQQLRPSFQALIRERSRGWRGGANPPAEQFAEAWRWCAEYRADQRMPSEYDLGYAYQPRRGACAAIAAAGASFSPNQPPRRLTPTQLEES